LDDAGMSLPLGLDLGCGNRRCLESHVDAAAIADAGRCDDPADVVAAELGREAGSLGAALWGAERG
jgi:hypothetical protein